MVVVEAAFIYPVVFAILAFLLFVGDMFYQRAWIEAAVMRYSLEGSAEIANSSLAEITVHEDGSGSLAPGAIENDPYRFVFNGTSGTGGVGESAAANEQALRGEVAGGKASVFGLAPNLRSVSVDYRSNLVYGDYTVSADYGFQLPIASFIVPEGRIGVDFDASSISTVTSMGEFVRNVDFADDVYDAIAGDARDTLIGLGSAVNEFRGIVGG